MAGLMVFKSLADALRAGFQIYDRTADGYLVRTRTAKRLGDGPGLLQRIALTSIG
jgi:hypothetical protein